MIVKVLQTFWTLLCIFGTGHVPLFEPYAVSFPNATAKQVAEMHLQDYRIKLTHWLNGQPFSLMQHLKWMQAEKTIRTMSLLQQADFSDHVTQKMVQEPIHILNEFVDLLLSEVQNKTLNDVSSSGIGNLAFLLLHLPPSKQQHGILEWFQKK